MSRIVFMGTPEYARRILELIAFPPHTFLVVTKPDMPLGRHRRVTPSAVAEWALTQGMDVLRPDRMRDVSEVIRAFQPDYIITAAFGRILRPWLLDAPRFGAYNLHASLLPRWRGPNPVAWAIREGDPVSGVTLMAMDAGIDTGPIVAHASVAIAPDDNTATLTQRMADLGATLWRDTIQRFPQHIFPSNPQSQQGVTQAPKFLASEGHIDWGRDAERIDAHIRAMTPEPGTYAMLDGQRLKVLRAQTVSSQTLEHPGRIHSDGGDWLIACGQGVLRISAIQPAGRGIMTPAAYQRGHRGPSEWMLR